jgi:beta-glucosidase
MPPQATFQFPRGFLWGTATSSHQVEGYNTNNQWWAWEQQPGRIINGDKSGAACDWWGGRWRADFDRAAETSQNAHRFSIEWSRVQPVPDKWDETAIDRYREMARGLHDREMTPLVTLHHFTDPLWMEEQGGWENEAVVEKFAAYTRKVVEALQEYVNLWVTINEPNIYTVFSYYFGVFPPGVPGLKTAMQVFTNLVKAHASAYYAIKEIQPTARIGISQHFRGFRPARSWSPPDRWLAGLLHNVFNDSFQRALATGELRFPFNRIRIPEVKGTQDYIGLNYFTEEQVTIDLRNREELFTRRFYEPNAEVTNDGFIANKPEGFYRALAWCNGFKLPIIITENGLNDREDSLRPRYLVEHLHQLWRAVNFNFPVKGYFHWTLVDNFEWERGWSQRFGLWELDVDTQARRKRRSADLYAEICSKNGISTDIVERYTPELVQKLFPG